MCTAGQWEFWIDVGGTFTDCIARRPDGSIHTHKRLSSGAVYGRARAGGPNTLVDPARIGEPHDVYRGYRVDLYAADGKPLCRGAAVVAFDGATGTFALDQTSVTQLDRAAAYQAHCDQPAPVAAIRFLMGLQLDESVGPIRVRLGTTRGTNALLERKGAKVGLVTTRGFADFLRIGHQARPELFDLNIRKPAPLFESVAEVAERIGWTAHAEGNPRLVVLEPPDEQQVREVLAELKRDGLEVLAVCLLNAYADNRHEKLVEQIARQVGFDEVTISTETAPLIGMVARGWTTVVDAYVTPVIRQYMNRVAANLPQARIEAMSNTGGLVAAKNLRGKDSLLSGPAGGVVGCAMIAKSLGLDRVIGFDMGGTSTDVCRYEGQFQYKHHVRTAGLEIASPMLAIETVAAGGGSICRFDGQKLTAGPDSAGAEPGPASYGRGGPLTVTDVNLALGRIDPELFPFPLDQNAVRERLDAVRGEISRGIGQTKSAEEIAEGVLHIVDDAMAAAVRLVSVAEGYDPRDYALIAFGGAGGQHACSVADRLEISTVVVPHHAAMLSAFGIGHADSKAMAERPVLKLLDDATLRGLTPLVRQIREDLARQVLADAGVDVDLGCRILLDLRYQAQESTLTVDADAPINDEVDASIPDTSEWRARFERLHGQTFGYTHADRPVEIVALRIEVVGKRCATFDQPVVVQPRCPQPDSHRLVHFQEGALNTAVFARASLCAGDAISGPAIIVENNSTIVIEAGWSAEVLSSGDIRLTRKRLSQPAQEAQRHAHLANESPDPVTLEVINNRFAAIAERMGAFLRRTAVSTNVKERLDYSCALFDSQGGLIANAPHIPVHLGAMSMCLRCLLEDEKSIKPGDVFLTNDPYRGGSHLPDLTVIMPVFRESGGCPLFFTAARAHHAEIGGIEPGSMPPFARSLAEEGVLIPWFRVLDAGRDRFAELRKLLATAPYPSRQPDENVADVRAAIAATRTGAADLLELIERQGIDLVLAYMAHIQNAAESKTRQSLLRLPQGRHSFVDQLDDGATIAVSIELNDGQANFDFAGSAPVQRSNFNANRAIVESAILYCLRCLIDERIPLNSGVLRPVRIELPPGMLNPPPGRDARESPAVAAGNVETSQRIVDVIFGALKVAGASQGTMNNLLCGNDRFGYYETLGGGAGAGPRWPGADAVHTHMTNTRLTDVEVLERRYPMRIRRFAVRCHSGGAGQFQGGCGLIREIEFLEPLRLAILSQRRTVTPYGQAGGLPGAGGRNLLIRSDNGSCEDLGPVAQVSVRPGDLLRIETPGGGGWGLEYASGDSAGSS